MTQTIFTILALVAPALGAVSLAVAGGPRSPEGRLPPAPTPCFPAGDYYIGDACYVLNRGQWEALPPPPAFGEHWSGTLDDGPYWMGWTAYGDGVYTDSEGEDYGVDSGTLRVFPVAACDLAQRADTCRSCLGRVVTFRVPFTPRCHAGVFTLGHLTIDTRMEAEEEDET